jgi:hypothetical protein
MNDLLLKYYSSDEVGWVPDSLFSEALGYLWSGGVSGGA